MKKLFASGILCLAGFIASAQFIYRIKGDSILLTNDTCNTELNLENSTRNVCGFLFNKGNGRTEFKSALIKINDSTYVVGCDTLKIKAGSGISGITADNGLTANTSTNVQLGSSSAPGSALLHTSYINAGTFNLTMTGTNASSADGVLRIDNTNSAGLGAKIGLVVNSTASSLGVGIQGTGALYGVTGSAPGSIGVVGSGNYGVQGNGDLFGVYGIGNPLYNSIGVAGQNNGSGDGGSFTSTGGGRGMTASAVGNVAGRFSRSDAANSVTEIVHISKSRTGASAAAGLGCSIDFEIESATDNFFATSNQIISKWTDATNATRTSQFEITGVNSGTTARKLALAGNGQLILDNYTNQSSFTGTAVANLAVDASGNVITTATGGGSGEANTASNLAGLGIGIFKDKSGVDLRFKRLKAGTGISITDNTDSVTITNTGMSNPMTTQGDIIYGASGGTPTRLALGSAGTHLTSDGSNVTWKTTTTAQATPADPTGTTSTTGVMMGLGNSITITPSYSGKVMIIISGDIKNATNADGGKVQIRYGTGSPPANQAAVTGTTAGGFVNFNNANPGTANIQAPWTLNAIVSGLTVGTAYWVDVDLAAITGGTISIKNVSISIVEL